MTTSATPPAVETSPDRLEFRFLWSAAEHRRFYYAMRRAIRRRGRVNWTTAVVLITLVYVALEIEASTGTFATTLLRIAPYVIILALWFAMVRWGFAHLSARYYERNHRPCIPHDQVRVIAADGIEANCVTSQVKIQWTGISRVVETPDFFLFFTTPACAIQLPKCAIPDADSLHALRKLLVQRISSRAELFRE